MTTFAGDAGELGVNLGTFVLGLAIALGDPLVFLLHRRKSTWVPVEKFRPINVALVLFVMDPAKVALQSA